MVRSFQRNQSWVGQDVRTSRFVIAEARRLSDVPAEGGVSVENQYTPRYSDNSSFTDHSLGRSRNYKLSCKFWFQMKYLERK